LQTLSSNKKEEDDSEKDERKQFEKISGKWPSNLRFKQTRRDLLKKYPELMSGIPTEMRYNPNKSQTPLFNRIDSQELSSNSNKPHKSPPSRSTWEEMRTWNYKKPHTSSNKLKIIIVFSALSIGLFLWWGNENIPYMNLLIKEITHLVTKAMYEFFSS